MGKDYTGWSKEGLEEEYKKSAVRIATFIDNFSEFMYYDLQEDINNPAEEIKDSDVVAFLTSLRKEVADFQARVKSLRERFQL